MTNNQQFEISFKSKLFFGQSSRSDKSDTKESHSLSLISNLSNLSKCIPRDFTITTRNGTYYFNKNFLNETSVTIYNHNEINNDLKYHLDIDDPKNVLGKFEQPYQGKEVIFEEKDISTCFMITQLLFITCCPNFMKPLKLRCQTKSNMSIKPNSYIELKGITSYIKDQKFKTFIITTKNNQYACNTYGIYFSDIIRIQLEKDPNNQVFSYDFDDENNEFQLICDLFNFESIKITKDNIDTLKEIAEDLQITSIFKYIDDFINNSEKSIQIIDDQQSIIDTIDELFDWLYNIKEKTVKTVSNLIFQSMWIETEENVQELVAFLLEVISTDILLHPYLIDLIIELNGQSSDSNYLRVLIPFIVQKLLNYLNVDDNNDQKSNKLKSKNKSKLKKPKSKIKKSHQFIFAFIYKFYKKGIIKKDSLIRSLKNYDLNNEYINIWLLPILVEMDTNNINHFLKSNNDDANKFIKSYLPDKIDQYEQMLDSGEPCNLLTQSLRNDDVDTFQSIISRSIFKDEKNQKIVSFNVFDYYLFRNTNYLNYAAAYGSLKCFKYLLLNDNDIDDKTFECAIYGGNIEIIKIVDQKCNQNNSKTHNDIIFSIKKHKNDLFDWLFEKKRNESLNLNELALKSAIHGNAHCLTEIIDKCFDLNCNKKILSKISKNGFYRLSELFNQIIKNKSNDIIQSNKKIGKRKKYLYLVYFGNLSIFNLFINRMDQFNINKCICFAVKNNYMSIINYYFDQMLGKEKNYISEISLNKILVKSFHQNDLKLFNHLLEKTNSLCLSSKIDHSYLLKKSIKHQNYEAIKLIIDITIEQFPNYNFTNEFEQAALSGLNDICQYLIDKKVNINYNILNKNCEKFGLLNKNIYSVILNQINPKLKTKFLMCINHAIIKKNHELIDYLFSENIRSEDALFLAVDTHDVEVVNIVLKYQNEPYFINKTSRKGTALIKAVHSGDLAIVKKLLSIPGINPSIHEYYYKKIRFPLTIALYKRNLYIANALIDFYGDTLQHQKLLLEETMKAIFCIYFNLENKRKSRILPIIYRILDMKCIDPNIYFNDSFEDEEEEVFEKNIDENYTENYIENEFEEDIEEDFEEEDVNIYHFTPIKGNNNIVEKEEEEYDEEEEEEEEEEEYIYKKESKPIIKKQFNQYMSIIKNNFIYDENETKKEDKNDIYIDYFKFQNLIKKMPIIKITKQSYNTFLLNACYINDIHMVKKLLKIDQINVNQYLSLNGDTPLITAIKKRNLSIAKILIKYPKTNINQRTYYDKTAFLIAAEMNLTGIVDLLLKNEKFDPKESQIDYAFYISSPLIRQKILSSQNGNLSDDTFSYILNKSAKKENINLFNLIINNKFFEKSKVYIIDAIIIAIQRNNFEIFEKLIKLIDDNINIHDSDDKSLIVHACKNLNEKFIDYILYNDKFDSKQSCILEAFVGMYSNEKVLKIHKMQNDINKSQISTRDKKQLIDLIEAKEQNIINYMNKLYNYDKEHDHLIDFTKTLPSGYSFFTTCSHYFNGIEKVFNYLIDHGADLNAPDDYLLYPLEDAIINKNFELAKCLINTNKIDFSVKITRKQIDENGANNRKSIIKKTGYTTYIHLAIQSKNLDFINEFLSRDSIDINITDDLGNTPLIEACLYRNYQCFEAIFKKENLDFSHQNNLGFDAICTLYNSVQEFENKNDYFNELNRIAHSLSKGKNT